MRFGAIINVIFLSAFLLSAVLIITNFTTIDRADWTIEGPPIVLGILMIFLGSLLLRVYLETNKKSILYVSIGFLVLAFARLILIYATEYRINVLKSIAYELVLFYAAVQAAGVILLFLGFYEIIKKRVG